MSRHSYPSKVLLADYLRSASGVFLPVALMIFTELLPLVFYAMAAVAILFAVYGLRTAWRQGTVLTVDGDGVRQEGPLGGLLDREIRWSEMRDIRLRYFSTRRDRRGGWMQLILRGGEIGSRGAIHMDSNLPGFDDVVRQAHAAARERGLAIDPTTASNLSSLGLDTDGVAAAAADAKSSS